MIRASFLQAQAQVNIHIRVLPKFQDSLKKLNFIPMKKLNFNILLILVGMLFLFAACCQKSINTFDPATERPLIEKSIHGSIGWAKNKDIQLLYSIMANDSNFMEIQPVDRVVRGFKEFKRNEPIWMSPDFKAIRYEIKDLTINISQLGNVAWFYCKLDDINEWKGEPSSWENIRWTGVLEKREGNWVIVQTHFSFPTTE